MLALHTDTIEQPSCANFVEKRESPRFTSLIRAAKLICLEGQFLAIIRDVSTQGVGLRLFHALPPGRTTFTLELPNGETFIVRLLRVSSGQASFRFDQPLCVDRLIKERWRFPKRQLRVQVAWPASLRIGRDRLACTIRNLSQQGA